MKVTLNLRMRQMRDLQTWFYEDANNDNADVLGAAIKEQKRLDVEEMNAEGRTPEERLQKLVEKSRCKK